MASRRIERLNEQLKREITTIVRDEVKDPRVGWVTVTSVEAAPDLSVARVYITTVGEETARGQMLEGLRAASPFIRSELGRRLRVRRIPELRFEIDRTLDRALRIERLLQEVRPTLEDRDAEADEPDEP